MTRHVRIPLLIAVVLALGAAPAPAATPAYKDARQPVSWKKSCRLPRASMNESKLPMATFDAVSSRSTQMFQLARS